jgi:hypothetical protein
VNLGVNAVLAASARDDRTHGYPVPRRVPGDAWTYLVDLAAEFVAQDRRWCPAGSVGKESMQLGSTDPNRRDSEDDLPRLGRRLGHLSKFKLVPRRIIDGFHGHSPF